MLAEMTVCGIIINGIANILLVFLILFCFWMAFLSLVGEGMMNKFKRIAIPLVRRIYPQMDPITENIEQEKLEERRKKKQRRRSIDAPFEEDEVEDA